MADTPPLSVREKIFFWGVFPVVALASGVAFAITGLDRFLVAAAFSSLAVVGALLRARPRRAP